MGEITVNSALSTPTLSTSAAVTPAPADLALNRAVAAGVRKLNDANYAGDGKEVTFSVDPSTRTPLIKVIDTTTDEVIQQWPPEYLLQIAADTKQTGHTG
jgi:uncharacterized FlaG/YvyC family protein